MTMATAWDVIDEVAHEAARRAGEIEAAGELPADLMDRVNDAGLLRMGLPAEWAGHDATPVESFRATLRLATGDGSLGWLVGAATSFHDIIAAVADPDLQARFFDDPRATLAGGVNGEGLARPVHGGFEVEGRWSFASGCRAASWLGGMCLDGGAGTGEAGFRFVMVPADRAAIVTNWDVVGLRATGSHDVVLPRQVVPAEWTFPFPFPLERASPATGPRAVAARGLWPTALGVAATQLGIARRALDEVVTFARTKHRPGSAGPLVDEQAFVRDVTRAEAAWRVAVAGTEATLVDLWERAVRGAVLDTPSRLQARMIATHDAQLGADIVRRCADLAGVAAIAYDHPLARCQRDGTLLAHHAVTAERTFEELGRVGLGLAQDSAFI